MGEYVPNEKIETLILRAQNRGDKSLTLIIFCAKQKILTM